MNVKDLEEKVEKILNEPDYIALKRYDNSLAVLVEKFPDGVPDHVIANALLVKEEEVEEIYQDAVSKIRATMRLN